MGTITPILDTLLPQVLGRAGDVARHASRSAHGPLFALRSISGEMPSTARRQTPYPGQSAVKDIAGTAGRAGSTRNAATPNADAARAPVIATGARQASSQLHLSQAGASLFKLLGGLGQAKAPAAAGAGPLVGHTGALPTSALAAALSQQVAASGLFYESHLARWVRGRYPIARLTAEPQAQFAAARHARHQSDTSQNQQSADHDATRASSVAPRLANLVRQQADLLAGGVFHWQGEAWPDAPMRWTIQQQHQPDAASDEDSATHSTSLSLTVGGLGAFEARLTLTGSHRISVAAWVEQGPGRARVSAAIDTLRERLRHAGFADPALRVIHEPNP